jgi:hypothetical protein
MSYAVSQFCSDSSSNDIQATKKGKNFCESVLYVRRTSFQRKVR